MDDQPLRGLLPTGCWNGVDDTTRFGGFLFVLEKCLCIRLKGLPKATLIAFGRSCAIA